MALRPGAGGGGSFIYPVGGGLGPPQGMMTMQPQQQQQGFPMVPVMQPNMQGMMGMNFAPQMPPGAMPMQGGMALGMQASAMPFMGQPQFMGLRPPGPQFAADMQKQMAEEHQKRLEHQQRLLEEDRKRRQFEEQKQKLRLLSSVKPKMGEKSRDDALEAIKGNLDGFSRDAKMHPTPSAHPKKPDSSPSHSSVTSHTLPSAFPEDDDEFSDFVQGPIQTPPSFPLSSSPLPHVPPADPSPQPPHSAPFPPVTQHSAVTSTSQSAFRGPSLEEKLFSSCDFTADKQAQVSFKPRLPLAQMGSRDQVTAHFQPSTKARNWATASEDLGAAFTEESRAAPSPVPADSGVGVYPQQDHIQPLMPTWLYNDSMIPELYKKVLEFSMTPAGIDTAKLYPILMSSGLPREALGQIWASANRTTPGKLTKEELYTVLAMIGVTQSGLPAMGLDILSQFPAPPVPNLPAMAMTIPAVLPQHSMAMAMSSAVPTTMPIAPTATATQAPAAPGFVASFPPVQAAKVDDDDFQEFQEAPKAGSGEDSFTDFQGETAENAFPTSAAPTQPQNSAPAMLTPVSGSSSSDKYAVFKQLSADQPAGDTSAPPASDLADKYSVFRQLEQPSDKKPLGDGFADFKSSIANDGFTDFKTADSVSPLEPPDQTRMFQPTFPPPFTSSQPPQQQPQPPNPAPMAQAQPRNTLNMADLDLFTSVSTAPPSVDTKPLSFSAAAQSLRAKPSGGGVDDFGDFALFGSSSSSTAAVTPAGGSSATQDDFADFMAFAGSGEPKSETQSGNGSPPPQHNQPQLTSDKYDAFKQLSLEDGALTFDDAKEGGVTDDFADFQSSKFCTALGASEKSLVDKVSAFKQAKEDSASVKSLDLPSIGGSSVGKEDSEDALSVQLDMKLTDIGGDLKHVMSDSSLDLPGLSSHQPPAAEVDDFKFDPFGAPVASGMAVFDWPDREGSPANQGKAAQSDTMGLDAGGIPSLVIMQQKDMPFGSTENMNQPPLSEPNGLPAEEDTSAGKFEAFADFGSHCPKLEDDDFGDFASTVSEKLDSPAASGELASEAMHSENTDEFGEFQGDKPKFGKFDFLKASSQAKVKSSEEMIRSELATFDLSTQGTHKRSHSLGEKEIVRSTPSPALPAEQPFRDRSSTLSDKPGLPVIRDKYKDLTGEVEESERYAYEWQRCLESALQVISKANNILNGISSSSVCTEVIQSAQGMEYLLGVVEVYRVTRRVELGIKATAVCSEKLQQLLKDISRIWNNLMGFMSLANLTPDECSLDFTSCILRHGIKNAKELACGVCLLNVESRSKAFNSETDNFKLIYGGHQYHASCANFWINCVEPKPPGLILPDLL